LALLGVLSAKIVLLHSMGDRDYGKFVDALSGPSPVAKVAGLVMTPDPASTMIASALKSNDLEELGPEILSVGDVSAGVAFMKVDF
jgi:hypothetical protein